MLICYLQFHVDLVFVLNPLLMIIAQHKRGLGAISVVVMYAYIITLRIKIEEMEITY